MYSQIKTRFPFSRWLLYSQAFFVSPYGLRLYIKRSVKQARVRLGVSGLLMTAFLFSGGIYLVVVAPGLLRSFGALSLGIYIGAILMYVHLKGQA